MTALFNDRVEAADTADIPAVLRLYEGVGYEGGVAEGDRVLVERFELHESALGNVAVHFESESGSS